MLKARAAGMRPEESRPPGIARSMDTSFKPAFLLMSGRVLGFAASFCIPIVFVRIFTQSEFGTYKQLFLIYATLYSIAQVGMAESLFYFLPLAPEKGGRYSVNSLLALAVAGLGCLAVLGTGGSQISHWLNNSALSGHTALIGIYLLLMLISSVLEIAMISRKQYPWAALSYALSDLVRAALYILPVVFLRKLEWLLLGAVLFATLRLGASLAYIGREFGRELRPDPVLLRKQLAYAVPFEMAVVADTLQSNFHQYAVSYYFDAATFAIYSVGCLQIPLVEFLASSAANVMMVRMAEEVREGRSPGVLALWHDTTRKLAVVFFPLVGLLLLNAREIIAILFTEAYRASIPIFAISSTGVLLASFMTDAVLRVYAQTHVLFLINVVRLVLVAAFINWFLSAFGLWGAVLVTLLATAVGKGWALARMKSLMHTRLSRILPWRRLAAILTISAVAGLPPLLIKTTFQMPTLALASTTSLLYAASYLALLRQFGLVSEGKELALARWLRGWAAGVARAGAVPQDPQRTPPARVRAR